MKRVSILTFHCADNFGAFLQAYALQNTIKDLDIDVEIIDFRPDELILPYANIIKLNELLNEEGKTKAIRLLLSKIYNYKNIHKRMQNFSRSREKYLSLSKEKFNTAEQLKQYPPNYDYYIVGSDQVWNPYFVNKIGDSYFLDFIKNEATRISYAASISETVPPKLISKYSERLNKFQNISVRETSAKAYLSSIIDKDISVHLDPAFLLEKEQWDEMAIKFHNKFKYILVYDLQHNEEIIKLANRIAAEKGYKVISYSKVKNYNNAIKSFRYASPEEFLGLIRNSEFILSTSFHGVAFALIYNKPFYAVPHTTRGTRVIDLLNMFNLGERIVYTSSEVNEVLYAVDYSEVNEIIRESKELSIKYLKNALNIGI